MYKQIEMFVVVDDILTKLLTKDCNLQILHGIVYMVKYIYLHSRK